MDGGLDDARFLVAKCAIFSGVGIESGDGNTWVGDATAFQKSGGEQADADNFLSAENERHAGERLVNGGKADGEVVAREEHREVGDAESGGKVFGLAGKWETDGEQAGFGNGSGDDGICGVGFQQVDGFIERGEGGGGGCGGGIARTTSSAIAEDLKLVACGQFPRSEREVDDFRADACRVAEGDENAGHGEIIGRHAGTAKRGNAGRILLPLAEAGRVSLGCTA